MTTDEQRTIALDRLKRRADFKNYLFIWLGVTLLVSVVWALDGFGYYWPWFVIFGMGIGAFVSALRAYGPGARIVTERDIDAELARANGASVR
jgi:hypothetical protein